RYQAIKVLSSLRAGRGLANAVLNVLPLPHRFRERGAKFRRLLDLAPRDWAWASQSYFSPEDWRALCPSVPLDDVVARHREVCDRALGRGAGILDAVAATDRELFLSGLNLMYADRASMHASVELRVPFLGEPVVSTA